MASTFPTIIPTRAVLGSYPAASAQAILNALVTETGFQATYLYNPASTATANGTSVIIPSDSPASGRWLIGLETSAQDSFALIMKTANYTVGTADNILLVNSASGSFTITVPRSIGSATQSKAVFLFKIGSDANNVTIADDLSNVLNVMFTGGQSLMMVVSNGTTVYANGIQ